jgi:adenylate kinase family enzyme
MVFGRSGSGKSTFSVWLSHFLGLPLHHLDKHFYVNNWLERNHNDFLQIQQNILDTECWIVDGNSIRSLGMRWAKADLVLYFNFPKVVCLYRILKRFFKPNRFIDDRALGCQEKLSFKLITYMWFFEKRIAQDIKMFKEKYPHAVFKEITCGNDLNKLMGVRYE